MDKKTLKEKKVELWMKMCITVSQAIGTKSKEIGPAWANYAVDEFVKKFK